MEYRSGRGERCCERRFRRTGAVCPQQGGRSCLGRVCCDARAQWTPQRWGLRRQQALRKGAPGDPVRQGLRAAYAGRRPGTVPSRMHAQLGPQRRSARVSLRARHWTLSLLLELSKLASAGEPRGGREQEWPMVTHFDACVRATVNMDPGWVPHGSFRGRAGRPPGTTTSRHPESPQPLRAQRLRG